MMEVVSTGTGDEVWAEHSVYLKKYCSPTGEQYFLGLWKGKKSDRDSVGKEHSRLFGWAESSLVGIF